MKNRFKVIIAFSIIFVISSCGGNEESQELSEGKEKTIEDQVKENPLGTLQELSKNLEKITKDMDNTTNGGAPIHYTDLQKYLPRTVEGYNMENPEGTTLSMEGFSVSSAEAEYISENGNYIRVSILDYNAAQSLFQMSTAMWNMGITIDSDQEYAKSFSLNDEVNGWEIFNKNNNKATATAGVGNRIMISVEGNNQINTDKVKEVLASMNIKSMIIVTNKTK